MVRGRRQGSPRKEGAPSPGGPMAVQATEVSGRVSGAVTLDPISPAYSATWLPVGPTFTSFTDTHIPHERAVLAAFPLSAFPGSAPSAALKPSLTSEAATRLLGTARALCREKAGEGPRTQSHCLLAPRLWAGIGLGVCVSRCRDRETLPLPPTRMTAPPRGQ